MGRFNQSSLYALALAAILLTPLATFSLPGPLLQADKHTFLFLALAIVFIIWLATRIIAGLIVLPRSAVFYAAAALWLVTLASAIFSSSPRVSILGSPFDLSTLAVLTGGFLLLYLMATLSRPISRVAIFYTLLFALALVLLGLRIFKLDLLGNWTDFGIFYGLVVIVSAVFLEFSWDISFFRILGLFGLLLSLFALALTNVSTLSLLVFAALVLLGLVKLWRGEGSLKGRLPFVCLGAALVLLIAVIGNRPGGLLLPYTNKIAPAPLTVRPSLSTSVTVAWRALSEHPLLGPGPNLFAREWEKYKPLEVNRSDFWSIDFSNASGFIPTVIVETGLLGLLAWLGLLVTVIWAGARLIRQGQLTGLIFGYALASVFAAGYLLLALFFFQVGLALLVLSFAILGLLIACQFALGLSGETTLVFGPSSHLRPAILLAAAIVVLGGMSAGYFSLTRYRALAAYIRGFEAGSRGDLAGAVASLKQSVALDNQDAYERTLATLELSSALQATTSPAFVGSYREAIQAARQSVDADPTNYLNYLTLGDVYGSGAALKINGAYEQAEAAYQMAKGRNPEGPFVELELANLEFARGNTKAAVPHLNAAVALKPNYAPAYLLAAQISSDSGDLATAIKILQMFLVLDPSNKEVSGSLAKLQARQSASQLSATTTPIHRKR